MTETLGRIGHEGTEELSRILDAYFAALIEQVYAWGGVVSRFAGDAMTILFSGEEAVLRALTGSLAMQRQALRTAHVKARAGSFTLRIKLGIAAGPVLVTVAGTGERADYLFAGPPLDQAAAAEHHAAPDEIVLHQHLFSSRGVFAMG